MTFLLREQYREVRTTLLLLKARYKTRKAENANLEMQLAAFRKLVTRQCIQIQEGETEISRLVEDGWD
jgi:hypothetical protein